jgi:hypothetical protein
MRGARHRRGDQHRVDQLAGPRDQLLCSAADQLAEDDAAVAARTQQRRARDALHDLLTPDLIQLARVLGRQALQLVEHRSHRERHVVARVAIGDREDIEVVDLLAPGLEVRERALDDGTEADETGIGGHGAPTAYAGPALPERQTAFWTLPALRQRVQT